MGIRTVFNILGPLTNPMRPPFGVIGAYSESMAKLMADALSGMDIERVFVIHGEPRVGRSDARRTVRFIRPCVRDLLNGEVRDPQDYRIRRCTPEDLAGGDATTTPWLLRTF